MQTNEIKISVIVPVYKEHDRFIACLESLKNQKTDFRYEILLECFGSDESMIQIAKDYERENPNLFFVYSYEKNLGIASSRNAGILQARGEYVTFVDSDDEIKENFLSFLMKEAKKHPKAEMLSTSYYLYGALKWLEPFRSHYHGEGKKVLYRFFNHLNLKYQVYCWARAYKTEFLRTNQIRFCSDMKIYEDWPFFAEVLYHAKEVRFYRKQLYHYVQRKGSAVHQKRDALYYNLKAIEHIRNDLYQKDRTFAEKVFGKVSLQMKMHMLMTSYISKELYGCSTRSLYQKAKKNLASIYQGEKMKYGPKKIS